jgi:Sulfotransferase family
VADPDYSFLDRLLHRLALNYAPIAEMSFDLDQMLVQADPSKIVLERHVFISGLARAGTSTLMRRFHSTGSYRSLTYRDMPFVLAPNLWRRLSSHSRRDIPSAERAHGDSLLVDADSPESFDEVFWRVFAGESFLAGDRLKPHAPDQEVVENYVRYVNAILTAQDSRQSRYLCKNNNSILRLNVIHQAFPRALILVPFREPLQHAQSLLRQHVRFSELQSKREFVLHYMTWLGHHEFGLDHRPFQFRDNSPTAYAATTLNYWLHLWCETYSWLERSKPESALFVCYEDLCTDTQTWKRLAELADVDDAQENGTAFKLSTRPIQTSYDPSLADRAATIYARLVSQVRTVANRENQ